MTQSAHQHARTGEQPACLLQGYFETTGEKMPNSISLQPGARHVDSRSQPADNVFHRLFTSTVTWSDVLTKVCYQDDAEQAAQHRKRVHLRAQLQVVICEDLHQRCLAQAGQANSVGQLAIKLHDLLKVMPQKVPC